jgi:geranyl-CoA carboxylase beta subunit
MRLAREILAQIDWPREAAAPRSFRPPRYDAEELLGIMPMDHKRPVDMKQVIARIVDDSDFLEFGQNYGSATVCGHVRIEGHPLGIITNNGPIDNAGASQGHALHPGLLPERHAHPVPAQHHRLHGGPAYEEGGMIKHGSKMIQAVTNATVPQITLFCGASFGAGNYGMCGRGFHPRFCFSWPNAKTAVMGGEQAAAHHGHRHRGGDEAQGRRSTTTRSRSSRPASSSASTAR